MGKKVTTLKGKPKKLKKVKKKYKKQKCAFVNQEGERCDKNAVGKSTLCAMHGGDPIIKENLLTKYDTTINSKYKPEYHPIKFIELSRDGLSPVEIAAQFEVAVSTLDNWRDIYEEFNTAWDVGASLYEAWWLTEARGNLRNSRYNNVLFKYITANKLGYAEKVENKGVFAHMHGVMVVPDLKPKDEWEQLAIEHAESYVEEEKEEKQK
jgi:hypothetical protein